MAEDATYSAYSWGLESEDDEQDDEDSIAFASYATYRTPSFGDGPADAGTVEMSTPQRGPPGTPDFSNIHTVEYGQSNAATGDAREGEAGGDVPWGGRAAPKLS